VNVDNTERVSTDEETETTGKLLESSLEHVSVNRCCQLPVRGADIEGSLAGHPLTDQN
jgi:hypothetical protein